VSVPGEDTVTAHGAPLEYPSPHRTGNRPYIPNEADVSFQDFMDPSIDWVQEPDYVRVFRELTGEEPMAHEAAYTAPTGSGYPPFINIATADQDIVQVTVRSAAEDGQVGTLARIHLHVDDWNRLIADAGRLAFPGKGADTAAARPEGAVHPYDGKPFPTPNDPLCQRTDPALPDDHPDNEGYYARVREPADSRGASAGDPLGQRASADLSGRHTDPTDTRTEDELLLDSEDAHNARVADAFDPDRCG
jgi:hypothetical protein